jgi:hypothetical protein
MISNSLNSGWWPKQKLRTLWGMFHLLGFCDPAPTSAPSIGNLLWLSWRWMELVPSVGWVSQIPLGIPQASQSDPFRVSPWVMPWLKTGYRSSLVWELDVRTRLKKNKPKTENRERSNPLPESGSQGLVAIRT